MVKLLTRYKFILLICKMGIWFFALFVLQWISAGYALNVQGLVPSVFTPFDRDGNLNLSVIPQYAKYLHQNNVNGALVAGTASEGPSLSVEERQALLDAWLEAARPLGLKVVMHVGGLPLPEVLELARYSAEAGPDALLTLPELYYKPADEETLVSYVRRVSDAAPTLPILYYDHPSLSGVKLNMAKFFKLATESIPNFKGIKCNFATALDITASNDLNDDQRIFMASHATTAPANLMGFNSSMTTISNLFPRLMLDIERAILSKDVSKARELQQELNRRVAAITEQGAYVPFVKAAMQIISGVAVGDTREPVARVSEQQKNILSKRIRDIGI